MVKSISCPTPETTGIAEAWIARATRSSFLRGIVEPISGVGKSLMQRGEIRLAGILVAVETEIGRLCLHPGTAECEKHYRRELLKPHAPMLNEATGIPHAVLDAF